MQHFKEVDWSDHEFAEYLRKAGGTPEERPATRATVWKHTTTGEVTAVVFYDNEKTTRAIFVPITAS